MRIVLCLILLYVGLVMSCPSGYYDPCGVCGGDGSTCSWHGTSAIGLTQVDSVKCSGEMTSGNRLCITVVDESLSDVIVKSSLNCPFDLQVPLTSDVTTEYGRKRTYSICATLNQLMECDLVKRSNETIDVAVSVDHYRNTTSEGGASGLQQISHQVCRLHTFYTKKGTAMTEYHSISLSVDASIHETYWSPESDTLYTVVKTCVKKPGIACSPVSLHFSGVSQGSAQPVELGCGQCEGSNPDLPPGYPGNDDCCQYWMFKFDATNRCVKDYSVLNFTSVYQAPLFNGLAVTVNLRTNMCNTGDCSDVQVPGAIELNGLLDTYESDSLTVKKNSFRSGDKVYAYFRLSEDSLPAQSCNKFQVHPFQLSLCRWNADSCDTVAMLYDSLVNPPLLRFSTGIQREYANAVSNPSSSLRRYNSTLCQASGFVFDFIAPGLSPYYQHSLVVSWVSNKNTASYLYRYLDGDHSISHRSGDANYISEKSRFSSYAFHTGKERFKSSTCDLEVKCSGDSFFEHLEGRCSRGIPSMIVDDGSMSGVLVLSSLILLSVASLMICACCTPKKHRKHHN